MLTGGLMTPARKGLSESNQMCKSGAVLASAGGWVGRNGLASPNHHTSKWELRG